MGLGSFLSVGGGGGGERINTAQARLHKKNPQREPHVLRKGKENAIVKRQKKTAKDGKKLHTCNNSNHNNLKIL